MEIKAKDMCPRCKYYLGMTPQSMYSCGKTYDGSELNIDIDVILNCASFEWKDGKVEGKVSDICHKCKNGKVVVWEGVSNIECEDPYDGMIKNLAADSDICCSMFEIRSEKKEEPCDKIPLLQHELEMKELRMEIHQLEKEKVEHLKGIERLKKSNNDLKGAYNHLLETIKKENEAGSKIVEENVKLEREKTELIKASRRKDELIQDYSDENKCLKLRNNNQVTMIEGLKLQYNDLSEKLERDEALINNIQKVIFPQEEGSDYTYNYDEILDKIKFLKAFSDENSQMYEELQGWKENCYKAETNVTTLNSKIEVLDKRNTNQCAMIRERDKEIENLKKMVERRDGWVEELQSDVYTLQNEVLRIRDIAQKAYDDTNRD